MRAYAKLTLIILLSLAAQWFYLRTAPLLEDVHLAARSTYLNRYGSEADRVIFNAALDQHLWSERSHHPRRVASP
jgi:hypothetical protein